MQALAIDHWDQAAKKICSKQIPLMESYAKCEYFYHQVDLQ